MTLEMTLCGEGVVPAITSSHPGGLLDFGYVLEKESTSQVLKVSQQCADGKKKYKNEITSCSVLKTLSVLPVCSCRTAQQWLWVSERCSPASLPPGLRVELTGWPSCWAVTQTLRSSLLWVRCNQQSPGKPDSFDCKSTKMKEGYLCSTVSS